MIFLRMALSIFAAFSMSKDLEEYTPYLSLLSELISAMDTEKYTKLELSNEILCMPAVFQQIWLCTQTVIMTITGFYGRLVEKH